MDAEGIKFWEPGKTEVTLVIRLVNPKEYVRHCAIDDNGVHCWNLLNKVPGGLIAPHNMTSVGRRGVCVVDQGAYKCW